MIIAYVHERHARRNAILSLIEQMRISAVAVKATGFP